MAGVFTAPIAITSAFTAQIDIFELLSGSGHPIDLLGFEFGQITEFGDAQEEVLQVILKRVTASPTSGSGGGTSTPIATNPGGSATNATLETGNTTKLTGGTSVELARWAWQVRAGCLYVPTPDEIIRLDSATRFVLELATTPADSIGGIIGRISFAELL